MSLHAFAHIHNHAHSPPAVEDEQGTLKLRLPNRLAAGSVKAASWQVRPPAQCVCMLSVGVCMSMHACAPAGLTHLSRLPGADSCNPTVGIWTGCCPAQVQGMHCTFNC